MEHPGKQIREGFLDPLGIHASQLAAGLGVDRSTVSRLLAGHQRITPTLAARLGAYFQVPPLWFLDMQARHDAAGLAIRPDATSGVTPLELDADWMLTPEGALCLSLTPDPPSAGPQTVVLDNGAVVLVGSHP